MLEGERIEHYLIQQAIGEGGMGVVHRAFDERLRRPVAIKFLSVQGASSHDARERIVREMHTVSQLSHPNICVLFDSGEHDGTPYLVLELLEGRPLHQLLREDGPLRPERALDVVCSVAEGLESAHEAGVLHRDIKPGNLFITDRGHTKILDFGIAKKIVRQPEGSLGQEASGQLSVDHATMSLTASGMIPGTMAYMSPEQLLGDPLDERSDLFSLGAVFYEMLTGDPAFVGISTGGIARQILEGSLPQLQDERLQGFLDRAMAREPSQRFASAREMADAARELRYQLRAESEASNSDHATPPRTLWGVAAALLGAGALWFVLHQLEWVGPEAKSPGRSKPLRVAVLPVHDASFHHDPLVVLTVPDTMVDMLDRSPDITVRPFAETSALPGDVEDLASLGDTVEADLVLRSELRQRSDDVLLVLTAFDLEKGEPVWRESLPLPPEDLLALREALSRALVTGLVAELELEPPVELKGPVQADAYRLYLETLPMLNDPGPNSSAIEQLRQAVELEPAHARIWLELARRLHVQGFYWEGRSDQIEAARAAAKRAQDLDPNLGEATSMLVEIDASRGALEQAYRTAEAGYRVRPNSARTHADLALVLRYAGQLERSRELCRTGTELDPVERRLRTCLWTHLFLGEREETDQTLTRTKSLLFVNDVRARLALMSGDEAAAMRLYQRQVEPSAGRMRRDYMVGCLASSARPPQDEASKMRFAETFEDLRSMLDPEWQFYSAGLFAHCGYPGEALELLRLALEGGYCVHPGEETDPSLARLMSASELAVLQERAKQCRARFAAG